MNATALAGAGIAALALAVGALAGVAGWRVIGSQGSSGDYAVAVAGGSASHPHTVAVRVIANPNQSVRGGWANVCGKGFGAGSKSGSFSGRSPVLRTMRMPMSNPDNCTASASAQLSGSGSMRVQILSR